MHTNQIDFISIIQLQKLLLRIKRGLDVDVLLKIKVWFSLTLKNSFSLAAVTTVCL